MPLSKARDKERKRLVRLERAVFQPDAAPVVRPYDPRKRYNPGDKVLIQQGRGWVETVIPELDGEGNPIYEEW